MPLMEDINVMSERSRWRGNQGVMMLGNKILPISFRNSPPTWLAYDHS